MKTQQFTYKPIRWSLVMAGILMTSLTSYAQVEDEEIVEEEIEVEVMEDTDTTKIKKVIKGKRITLTIATRGEGGNDTQEISIDLPASLSETDAESIEEALEEAGEALEEAMEEAGEAMEEALEQAAEAMEAAEEAEGVAKKHQHKIVIHDGHMKKVRAPKLVETSWHVMDLGINEMLTPNGDPLPAEYADMKIIPAKSINFHWGIVQQGINISGASGKLRLVYGLGIDFNNYRFREDIDLTEGSDPLVYTVNADVEYRKNKLVTQYLTMPLMLNFKSNPHNENKSLNLAAGVHGGYLIGSHQKQKWEEGGSKEKKKLRGDYGASQYRLGYAVQFGYGDVNIYARYYPDPIFTSGVGPELNTAAVGIVIMPF